jgi:sulfhydrogenase subunit beta (sulfur reductase)
MTQWQRLDRSDLPAVLSALREVWDVFAPVEEENDLRIREVPVGGDVFLGPRKPLLPLKMLFLPEVEDLFSFTTKGTTPGITPVGPLKKERVVLGVLGCDIAALEIQDRVFLGDPVDEWYQKRREQTILVAMACVGEGPECFCTSFGIDPLQPSGADAVLADIGDSYFLKTLTEKGKRVEEVLKPLLKTPLEEELSNVGTLVPPAGRDVPVDRVPMETKKLWDLSIWDDLAARCLGCGACTVLCPTCHCFDLEDEQHGCSGKRFRAWDSCMNPGFTKMASGENPRPTKRERVRQRFLHKLSYFPLEKGIVACVGCGRCSVHCPVGIRIDEVIVELTKVFAGVQKAVFSKRAPWSPKAKK